jgi:hypothetical protein
MTRSDLAANLYLFGGIGCFLSLLALVSGSLLCSPLFAAGAILLLAGCAVSD